MDIQPVQMDAADHAPAALRLHHHADGHLPGAGGVGDLKIAHADVRQVFDMQAVGDAGAGGGAGISLSADDEIRFGHAVGMDDGPGARLRAHGIAVVHIHHDGAFPAAGASEGEALPLKDRARLQQHPVARLEGEGVDLAQGLPGRVGAGALAAVVAALGVHVEGGAGGVFPGEAGRHRHGGIRHDKSSLSGGGIIKFHPRLAGPAREDHVSLRRVRGHGDALAQRGFRRSGGSALHNYAVRFQGAQYLKVVDGRLEIFKLAGVRGIGPVGKGKYGGVHAIIKPVLFIRNPTGAAAVKICLSRLRTVDCDSHDRSIGRKLSEHFNPCALKGQSDGGILLLLFNGKREPHEVVWVPYTPHAHGRIAVIDRLTVLHRRIGILHSSHTGHVGWILLLRRRRQAQAENHAKRQ